ncbi:hypothetical protein DDZ13_12630 [Coraliomargarita sinensis]|uniref:FecR protein domain-containing protein n=1 Tax=Coraliomargarita sinensis TaxID=2174842 RepID=A0A317ZDC2_9BACT|nr:hypothetical protein [Coraliomargarita sinensis]PXA03265.1 hypothetical protein DDZ13_12630 [Coraliomargarita sinensis]
MRTFPKFVILLLVFGVRPVAAEAWVRGSAMVVEASGEVQLTDTAAGKTYQDFGQATYFSGMFSSQAQADGSILIHTSNAMTLGFRGGGYFSVERFEGLYEAQSTGEREELTEIRSRMILNLRRGELLIDSRSLTADSKFVVETPFGRISSVKAVLLVRIDFDYRSNIYDFTISCTEGTVRLSDKRGESYLIYAGQRISGAGSYLAPAIEVGEQTDQIREKFEQFLSRLDRMELDEMDQTKLWAHTKALADFSDVEVVVSPSNDGRPVEQARRPRVIEFAPRAETISPFRGEVKPPSKNQAELF